MRRLLSLLVLLTTVACGASNPRARYLKAVNAKLGGDLQTYSRELMALASEAPDTREGRAARSALTSSSVLQLYVLGAAFGVAIPNFMRFSARATQSDAKSSLNTVYLAWAASRAEGAGAQGMQQHLSGVTTGRYYLFVKPGKPFATPTTTYDLSAEDAARALSRAGITPVANDERLVAAAVGNLDGDADLDIWVIDDQNALVNFTNDLE